MQQNVDDLVRPNQGNEDGADAVQERSLSSKDKVSTSDGANGVESQSAEAEGEETRKPQIARRPNAPSKADLEDHLPLHLEYRSWCPHCVAGKGISDQHRQATDGHNGDLGITVSLDYCFMTAEEAEDDMRAILICYDHNKSGLWALPVEHKGAQQDVIKWVVDKLEECGYSGVPVTLKSDQEPAMISLKQGIAIRRKAETPMIESPVRESKSNGRIERAIRKWQAQFRTIRHHLESRLRTSLDNQCALVEWMIVWVADMLSKFKVHENGKTNYEMNTQHKCKHKIIGFGEKVYFQFKMPDTERNACSNEKSGTGYFVGIVNRNTQYLISTSDGIIACSTVRRLPDEEAYDKTCLEDVKVKYSDYIHGGARTKPTTVKFASAPSAAQPDQQPIVTNYASRALKLTAKDFVKHDFTAGCAGCEYLVTGLGGRKGHSSECRQRMEDLLAGDDAGSKRVKEASERRDLWLAEQLHNQDVKPSDTVVAEVVDADMTLPEVAPEELVDARVKPSDTVLNDEHEREQQNSTAYGDTAMSPVKDDSTLLEDGASASTDIRIRSPVRAPPVKRRTETEDESMGDEATKIRRTRANDESMAEPTTAGNDDVDILSLDKCLGSIEDMSPDERRIVAAAIFSVDITEVFSPVRVTEVAAKYGLVPGTSFDLTNGWDFSIGEHRTRAWKHIKKEDPYCVIGSPPCTLFSMLMELVKTQHKGDPEWAK